MFGDAEETGRTPVRLGGGGKYSAVTHSTFNREASKTAFPHGLSSSFSIN